MLRLRPYQGTDADVILSWPMDEKAFYQWTAGILGAYPLTKERFSQLKALTRFTLLDENEVAGFFTLRNPKNTPEEVRFGFVIVDPRKRGRGYGKEMLRLGLKYAFEIYGAQKATLGVFENNPSAYFCYKAAGFRDVTAESQETYTVMGEEWKCLELTTEEG
ncbi:MAG: GNAT family N-acetyltransferase [Clostridia bacterium]|nr:GNAT family N-acetyltransferase [Clostridia bacterium]